MSDRGLSELHLADLHARAAELGIEGYRLLPRGELVAAIEGASRAVARSGDAVPGEAPATGAPGPEEERLGEVEDAEGPRTRAAAEPRARDAAEPRARDAAEPRARDAAEPRARDAAEPRAPEAEESTVEVTGVLELTRQRFGFLRLTGLHPDPGDVYISASQVRRCELRTGDEVAGPAREPRPGERHRALVHVDRVNGAKPPIEGRQDFEALDAVLAERRLPLDSDPNAVLARAVDLLAPLALGQRVLVRAAPRSGRTTLLREVARGVTAAEGVRLIVLLIDERPEEATAWREAAPEAELAIATAELPPRDQLHVTELALERGRRLAEAGEDAVLLCDSLSRLAFVAGDPAEVKRLFGSGRNLAVGGSLTVIATVLADHDEGEAERAVATTESALVTLDPALAAAGVVPAIRAAECRISNEDQLRDAAEIEAVRRLRSLLAELDPPEAAALLRERIAGSASNAELLGAL